MSEVANNVFEIVADEYNNPLASVITDYQAAQDFENDKWGDMVRYAHDSGASTGDEWKEYYTPAEEEQVRVRELGGEVVKRTKTGKIVASAAFPKTWNTDKAIIGKALDSGVTLLDENGNPKPKTAIQEEYKEANKSEKTAMEKIMTTINTYGALYAQLESDDERELARKLIEEIHGK